VALQLSHGIQQVRLPCWQHCSTAVIICTCVGWCLHTPRSSSRSVGCQAGGRVMPRKRHTVQLNYTSRGAGGYSWLCSFTSCHWCIRIQSAQCSAWWAAVASTSTGG
jgi:hypothetical protein